MDGVKLSKFCQSLVRRAKKNFWKLKDAKLGDDVVAEAKKLGLPPVLVVREILKRKGFTKSRINQALRNPSILPPKLAGVVRRAEANDPVFSPRGTDYSKWKGDLGEEILCEWLEMQGIKFERDLGRGLPDLLFKEDIVFMNKKIRWIESKASYGDEIEAKNNMKQFKKFDALGDGVIVYWFGVEGEHNRVVVSGEEVRALLPKKLRAKVDQLLSYVPPDFRNLIL